MNGSMMQQPLLISSLLTHAERHHGEQEVVSRRVEGDLHRITYRELAARSRRMANALAARGIGFGDRVATLAWNGYRHMELYYAASGSGAVLHTLNPRLHPDQVVWIADHAEDQILFFDLTFLPLVEAVASRVKTIKAFVAMTDRAHMPVASGMPGLLCYEELIEGASDEFDWPTFDENTASSLCYTSGTTGNPKGALYSHRSTLLHTYAAALPDALNCSSARRRSCRWCRCSTSTPGACPTSPAWSAPSWSSPAPGSTASRCTSCSRPRASPSRPACRRSGRPCSPTSRPTTSAFSTMRRTVIGGSACPPAMMRAFQQRYDVHVLHAWGMTEMSPLGTVCSLKPKHAGLDPEARMAIQAKQGRAVLRRRDEDRRRGRPGAAARRQDLGRADGARPLDHRRATSRATAATRSSTAGSRPATSPPSTPTATCRSPTAART